MSYIVTLPKKVQRCRGSSFDGTEAKQQRISKVRICRECRKITWKARICIGLGIELSDTGAVQPAIALLKQQ